MADPSADLFAIPDFWRLSSWQQPLSLSTAKKPQGDFFSLDINGAEPLTVFLGTDDSAPPQPSISSGSSGHDGGGLFKIPDLLRELQTDAPETPETTPQQSPDSDKAQASPAASVDDIWLTPDANIVPPPRTRTFRTWAAFEHVDVPNPIPHFATEQGPRFLDALIAANDNPLGVGTLGTPGTLRTLDARGYCGCLLSLCLGRSSVLFVWNEEKRCFLAAVPGVRLSGFTAEILRSVERDCLACGNDSRFLRSFVDRTYAASASASMPSRVALAQGVDRLLLTIQSELGTRGHKARSLLQLQALVQPVASLVRFIRGLVTKLGRAAAAEAASDEIFLTRLFQEAQSMEYSAVSMRGIMNQLLQLVSAPWLAFVCEWIGLDPRSKARLWTDERQSRGFVRFDDQIWIDDMGAEVTEPDYFLDEDKMPAFIPVEMARDLFETGRNLRFLWTNHPDHPLSNPATVWQAGPPPLRWQFDWASIHALDRKTHAYERALSVSLATRQPAPSLVSAEGRGQGRLPQTRHDGQRQPDSVRTRTADGRQSPGAEAFQFFGKSRDQIEQSLGASMAMLDGPPAGPAEDKLGIIVRQRIFDNGSTDASSDMAALDEFAPHWSLLPLLSFGPVITAQARLVNRACMKLLFDVHGLREHLALQRAFQLLGNGVFCGRLSHALFDPDLAGAETSRGIELSSGGLGLRLSSRDHESWPPASSELRLALMGVLADSYYEGGGGTRKDARVIGTGNKTELPGGMSFAVRDLTVDEMDRCMDPDGLEAVDFLRLTYKPPSALMAVITPTILGKYDRIFRLLMQVLRLYYVVNRMADDDLHPHAKARHAMADSADNTATRFRIEARHFVANIMAYFWDTAVGMPWHRFDAWLDGVQADLVDGAHHRRDGHGGSRAAGAAAAAAAAGATASPEKLRARHEQTLDEMLLALLLRKRQRPLLVLLQGIFGVLLEFAKSARERTRADAPSAADADAPSHAQAAHGDRTKKLHASFRRKVAAFLAVCRGLSEKEADSVARKDYQQQQQYQDGSRAGEGSALSALVLMLDYNGAYTTSSQ